MTADAPAPLSADEQLVAREVARLRDLSRLPSTGALPGLQANLLETVPVRQAAEYLRELALRALDAKFGGEEEWKVSAMLMAEVGRERRRARGLSYQERPGGG